LANARLEFRWAQSEDLDALVYGTIDVIMTLLADFAVIALLGWVASILIVIALVAAINMKNAFATRMVSHYRVRTATLSVKMKTLKEDNIWLANFATDMARREVGVVTKKLAHTDKLLEIRRHSA
jgi:hypothetical protein